MSARRLQHKAQLASYLDRVRSAYPYGIPAGAIRSAITTTAPTSDTRAVSFIVCSAGKALTPEHETLLESIASKGLKLTGEQTRRCVVQNREELSAAIDEHSKLSSAVLVLGSEQEQGSTHDRGGSLVLYSYPLSEIATLPAIKREFWGHLQGIIERLG